MYKPHKRSRSHNGAITSSGYCLIAFYVCSVVLRELDPFRVVVAFQHQTLISHCNHHAGLHRCLKASNDQEPQLQPWTEAIIDYSGANEYFEAHYGKHPFLDLPPSSAPYFGGDKILEPIYNGRELGIVGEDGLLMASKIATTSNNTSTEAELSHHVKSLKKYGMALIDSPTRVIDWKNKKQIENVYIQELEQILPSLFSTKIKLHSFWNPMLRGENHTISAPLKQNSKDTNAKPKGDNNSLGDTISTANVASMVHGQILQRLEQRGITGNHIVPRGKLAGLGLLRHVGDAQAFKTTNIAGIRLELLKQQGKQARFPAAVTANQRNLLPGL